MAQGRMLQKQSLWSGKRDKLPSANHVSALTGPSWGGTLQISTVRIQTYSKKMSQGNRETNGQRCWSWDIIPPPVCGGKDTQHQLEGSNDFNTQSLARIDSLWKLHGDKKENVTWYSTSTAKFCRIYFLNGKTQTCTAISLLKLFLLNKEGKIKEEKLERNYFWNTHCCTKS